MATLVAQTEEDPVPSDDGAPRRPSAQTSPDPGEESAAPAGAPEEARPPRTPPASSEATRRSMQGNRSKDTKPEMLVRRHLREHGLTGYRLQWKKAPGRPDVAFVGKRVALFVNGCFWHRCPYCAPSSPRTNVAFWEAKFARNRQRDERNVAELVGQGWTVIVVWECLLKKKRARRTMEEVVAEVRFADARALLRGSDAGVVVTIGRVPIRGPQGLAARRVAKRARGVHRHV